MVADTETVLVPAPSAKLAIAANINRAKDARRRAIV
jgi:hypothetical protein